MTDKDSSRASPSPAAPAGIALVDDDGKPIKLSRKAVHAIRDATPGKKVPNIPQPKELPPRPKRASKNESIQIPSPSLNKGLIGDTFHLTQKLPLSLLGFRMFYNMIHADRGFMLPRHLAHLALGLTDARIPKLLVIVGPGSGKSVLLSTAFPAFMLGQDPSLTICGISAGESLMQGFMSAVMEWVEHSIAWRYMFPEVVPDKGRGWSTERGMFVKGHSPGDPDASYIATGLTSKRLTGVHARLVIGDDLHDKENSATAAACQSVIDTYYSQIIGRADPRGARFVFAGRRWHEEDIYGHLKKTGEWVVMELPAVREKSLDKLYWDITVPDGLECCFTEIVKGEQPMNWGVPESVEEAVREMQAAGFNPVDGLAINRGNI
jgi:hypothetical protein